MTSQPIPSDLEDEPLERGAGTTRIPPDDIAGESELEPAPAAPDSARPSRLSAGKTTTWSAICATFEAPALSVLPRSLDEYERLQGPKRTKGQLEVRLLTREAQLEASAARR